MTAYASTRDQQAMHLIDRSSSRTDGRMFSNNLCRFVLGGMTLERHYGSAHTGTI